MEKPTEVIKDCPACGNHDTIELHEEQVHFTSPKTGFLYVGYMWLYKCKHCAEDFTTTESDTISENYIYKLTMPEDVKC